MPPRAIRLMSSNPFIFDRRRHDHPWETALSRLQTCNIPGMPALAANWRMDCHVDNIRENHLINSGCFPSTTNTTEFSKSVSDYFAYYQCLQAGATPEPGYAGAENGANLIPYGQRPNRNHYLLHLASINRLLKYVLRASNPNRADFQIQLARLSGERPLSNAVFSEVDKLADILNTKGPDTVKKFARIVSDALGSTEPHWWAAFAHEVRNFASTEDWTDTVRVLGLGDFEPGERLLAWRYSPELAGSLFRPTVAEARDSGFYFPSPPDSYYGITMPLSRGMAAVKELVHAPLKGDACYDSCTGSIGKIENQPVTVIDVSHFSLWFEERRKSHRSYLLHRHPDNSAQNWLGRHSVLP